MMSHDTGQDSASRWTQPERVDDRGYENPFATSQPIHTAKRWRPWLCLVLVALALVPRAIVAHKLEVLCPDGVFWIDAAERLAEGRSLSAGQFNPFPIALGWIHRSGLSWEAAARLLNVVCGSLLVLPVFAWLRRAFDDRLAVLAAVLLAVHPKLVDWSGEVVREPLFLLAFAAALWALWRAVAELRMAWFLAAGATIALAVQTRFEGWFLLVPAAIWSAQRLACLRSHRRRLLWGAALIGAFYPLTACGLNLAAYGHVQRFDWGSNLHRLDYLQSWLTGRTAARASPPPGTTRTAGAKPAPTRRVAAGTSPLTQVIAATPASASPGGPATTARTATAFPPKVHRDAAPRQAKAAWLIARTVVRGYTPWYGLLVIVGVVMCPQISSRRDFQPNAVIFLLTLAAMWIHLANAGASSSRYCLTLVVLAAPFAALGLDLLSAVIANLIGRVGTLAKKERMAVAARYSVGEVVLLLLLVPTAAYTYVAAALADDPPRSAKAELGRWLQHQFGPKMVVVGSRRLTLAGYYARAEYVVIPEDGGDDVGTANWIEQQSPHIVLLAEGDYPAERLDQIVGLLERRAFAPLRPSEDQRPAGTAESTVVLVHGRQVRSNDNSRSVVPR